MEQAKNAGSNFESLRANVKVKSGKWYYEVKLITNGLFQIGWCTSAFAPDAAVRIFYIAKLVEWREG